MASRDTRGRSRRPAKPGTIEGQFIAHRVEMLESDAWAALTFTARRVLDRLEIEHAHHGGKENGKLVCTYNDFAHFGIRRPSIANAIRQLVSLGFVEITHKGRGGNAEYRDPSRYRLTYLAAGRAGPTDDWRDYSAPVPLSPRDIESRYENVTGPVGTKTYPKTRPAGNENVSETRNENVPGFTFSGDRHA